MRGLIFQSSQVTRGRRTRASGRLRSTLPNADKLLKHLATQPEEVMLAPAELQVLPKQPFIQHTLSSSLLGNKVGFVSRTLSWRFSELNTGI